MTRNPLTAGGNESPGRKRTDFARLQINATEKETQNEILLSISNQIARIRSKEDMLHTIRHLIRQHIHFDDSFILRYNKANKTYTPYIYHVEKGNAENTKFEEQPDIWHVVVHDNISNISAFPFIASAGIAEFVSVKLAVGDQLVGLFVLLSERKHSFTQKELDLLKRISCQISMATAIIIAHEEIDNSEQEKTLLLSLSIEIASLSNREDLFRVVNNRIKEIFSITHFGIGKIDDDQLTHSAFVMDLGETISKQIDQLPSNRLKYSIKDKAFTTVMASEEPVIIDVDQLANEPNPPEYVLFWQQAGFHKLLCLALRVGGKPIGAIFFNIHPAALDHLKIDLLKGICAQLSVAVSNILANEKVLHQFAEIDKYKRQLEEEKTYLQEEIKTSQNHTEIIGESAEIKKVFRMVTQVAYSDSTVLLLGETGTGKELIARAIHNNSTRRNKLMVKVNCAALPANLIESELFGHERGSFTGAHERRIGKFELANHGTLFLDEIGEMPLDLQVKLLRALQEKEIERVGGKTTIKTDVRIIAATNRDLEKLMEEGKFRSDLYYRLNIFPISLPPLRQRKEDIPQLTSYFIVRHANKAGKKIKTIHNRVLQELIQYNWPGNIRELEHLIERSVLLATGDTIEEIHLPQQKRNPTPAPAGNDHFTITTIDENEKDYILKVLRFVNGRIGGAGGAAELLGIPPSTLNSRMKRLGIRKEHFG